MLTTHIVPTNHDNGQKPTPDAPQTKYTVDQLAMALAAPSALLRTGLAVEVRRLKVELAETQAEMAELEVAQ